MQLGLCRMLAVWRATIAGVALVVAGVVLAQTVDATRWLTADGLRAAVGADEWYGPLCYVSAIVGGMFLPIPKVVRAAARKTTARLHT